MKPQRPPLPPSPVFSIHRFGANSQSRGHEGGRRQETCAIEFGNSDFHPSPVRVLVKNGIVLAEPEFLYPTYDPRGGIAPDRFPKSFARSKKPS